jgi:penicillin amidase
MNIIEEEIIVKDESQPRIVTLYSTTYGPVVQTDSVSVVSLKWAGFDFDASELVRSAMKLHSAANFQQFREVVTGFGALDVNWTYSDINGNIGYQLGTPIPRRDFGDTFFQLAAEDSSKMWKGYYNLEDTPYLLNPPGGWLATCNNRIVSDKWPYDLAGFYDPYRINRATKLLSGQETFSPEDFEAMQLDLISGLAWRWKDLMAEGAEKLNQPELFTEIQNWDGGMTVNSQTASLFALWWHFLDKHLFEDELGEDWKSGKFVKEEVLTANLQTVIDDRRTDSLVENAGDISAATLSEILNQFGRQNYGDICKLILEHPLSQVKILDYWLDLNRGPYPIGGDHGSLKQNYLFWDESQKHFRGVVGPSMRFILDWSNVDEFTINTNLGQSGNPFSPHYDDFLEMMQSGDRWRVPFSKTIVYELKRSLLKLAPKD